METERMTQAELEKIHAEISKLMAETAKINQEGFWYPMVVSGGLVMGIITLTKLFL